MNTDNPAYMSILGNYPPPNGGVANHIRRLCTLLDARGVDYRVYNAVSASQKPPRVVSVAKHRKLWMLTYPFYAKERVIYILSDRLEVWLLGALMARLRDKHVIIRLRNKALPERLAKGGIVRWITAWSLRNVSAVVSVSQFLADCTRQAGVDEKRIIHQPGFLPPAESELAREQTSQKLWQFVEGKTPILAANGKVSLNNNQDIYGLDQLLELAVRLKPDYPKLALVVCFWDHKPHEQAYVDTLMARAKTQGVAENIFFNTEPGLFVPVLKVANVFVRPTLTDGDANSVREALFFNVPAVASDVVERPDGTLVFKTGDVDDLARKVRIALTGSAPLQTQGRASLIEKLNAAIETYLDFILAH